MSITDPLRWDALHHGYLLVGEHEIVIADLLQFFEKVREFDIRRNPDFSIERYDTFSIDDARKLGGAAVRRALSNRRIFIVAFHRATEEAQNALLKVLEEPVPDTHFFLIVPKQDSVIGTVRSRLVVIEGEKDIHSSENTTARAFLEASGPSRLSIIADFLDDEDGNARARAIVFVREVEQLLFAVHRAQPKRVSADVFHTIEKMLSYLSDPSGSVKLILEHLSLAIPRLSL